MTPAEKIAQIGQMCWMADALALSDIERLCPDADARETWLRLAARRVPRNTLTHIQTKYREQKKESTGEKYVNNESLPLVLRRVLHTFETLHIPYFVGGSVASSVYGEARFTQDIDLIADIRPEQAAALMADWQDEFYVDAEAITEAIQTRTAFNIIHLPTLYKADIFILENSRWQQTRFERRSAITFRFGAEEDSVQTFISSPEDMILQKLKWFQLGGSVSDRQWRDVLGMLEVQQPTLDGHYLRHWAEELGLNDLLNEALEDAQITL